MITFLSVLKFQFSGLSLPLVSILLEVKINPVSIGPFIRGKIRRVLNKTRTVPFIRAYLI